MREHIAKRGERAVHIFGFSLSLPGAFFVIALRLLVGELFFFTSAPQGWGDRFCSVLNIAGLLERYELRSSEGWV